MKPFPPIKISPKIELTWPEMAYAEPLFNIISLQREYLGKWLTWVEPIREIKDVERFLYEARLFNEGGQKLILFILYEKKLVGSVAIVKIDKVNLEGEIGYWLDQNFQGKGIITKSCQQLIELAFEEIQLHRLIVKINLENSKSLMIPERLGFKLEGTLREATLLHGIHLDTKLFSLLKKDLV